MIVAPFAPVMNFMNFHAASCLRRARWRTSSPPRRRSAAWRRGRAPGSAAVRHLNLPATPSSATRSSEVDSVQMPSLPAKNAARLASGVRSGMPPSRTMRPSSSIDFLPGSWSNATVFSSSLIILPPWLKTSACHIQLPVIAQEWNSPTLSLPSLAIFLASSKMPSQVVGNLAGSPPALVHQVVVDVDDRRRGREGEAIGLSAVGAERHHRLGEALALPVLLLGDEGREVDGDLAVDEQALEVDRLQRHVGKLLGDRLPRSAVCAASSYSL